MKIWPKYKVFSFKRVPFFMEDEDGPRAGSWIKIAACATAIVGFIYIAIEKF
jgi:hypothetical protein